MRNEAPLQALSSSSEISSVANTGAALGPAGWLAPGGAVGVPPDSSSLSTCCHAQESLSRRVECAQFSKKGRAILCYHPPQRLCTILVVTGHWTRGSSQKLALLGIPQISLGHLDKSSHLFMVYAEGLRAFR